MDSSRLENWVAREEQELEARQTIMADGAVTVDVYRSQSYGSNPGFGTEVPKQAKLKSINARIEPPKSGGNPLVDIMANTDDRDVKVGDWWRYTDLGGVARIAKVTSTMNWLSGCEVGLKYGA